MNKNKKFGLTSNGLKLIAMLTMLIDHVGFVCFPHDLTFRYVGRIAFPIYCFLLTEGFFYTKNVYRYLLRLGIFALISEVPFHLGLYHSLFRSESKNVFFTLLIGLIVLVFAQYQYEKKGDRGLGILFCLCGMLLAENLHTDYGAMGVLMIYVFYITRESRNSPLIQTRTIGICAMLAGQVILMATAVWNAEIYATYSLPLILLYDGRKSGRIWERLGLKRIDLFLQYLFYGFYPIHLLILYFVSN